MPPVILDVTYRPIIHLKRQRAARERNKRSAAVAVVKKVFKRTVLANEVIPNLLIDEPERPIENQCLTSIELDDSDNDQPIGCLIILGDGLLGAFLVGGMSLRFSCGFCKGGTGIDNPFAHD